MPVENILVEGIWASTCVQASVSTVTLERGESAAWFSQKPALMRIIRGRGAAAALLTLWLLMGSKVSSSDGEETIDCFYSVSAHNSWWGFALVPSLEMLPF